MAVLADIEQMFHSFTVKEDHRGFLCFNYNDPSMEIVEYRIKVHFGNNLSPAVNIDGLHHAVQHGASEYGMDAKQFAERDFYFHDGLKSVPSAAEDINLLKRTQEMLAPSDLWLLKITSNHSDVLEDAFQLDDHAKGLENLDFDDNSALIQCSLGLSWDLKQDVFTFKVAATEKPFTRRGVLATVNSLFEALRVFAPIIIQGKFLLWELISCKALDCDKKKLFRVKKRLNGKCGETLYKTLVSSKYQELTPLLRSLPLKRKSFASSQMPR